MRIRSLLAVVALFSTALVQSPASADETFIVGGDRPVKVQLPDDTSQPSPLLIMLHSASSSGAKQEKRLKLAPVAKKLGMIYIAPDGTVGVDGRRVWNAAKACCQKPGTEVDDLTYLDTLIEEIDQSYPVDRSRIYFVGHSNGAFMSLAYACATGKVAAVVSAAGAMDVDSQCLGAHPFAFLHIHGVADATIKINGGVLNFHAYTSAAETLYRVAQVNGCVASKFSQASFAKKDFEPTIPGSETSVHEFSGCAAPTIYWRVARGAHSLKLPANYADQILTFLSQNVRGLE